MDVMIRKFLKNYYPNYKELPQPNNDDPLRNEWVKIIVNQTLKELGKAEKGFRP